MTTMPPMPYSLYFFAEWVEERFRHYRLGFRDYTPPSRRERRRPHAVAARTQVAAAARLEVA